MGQTQNCAVIDNTTLERIVPDELEETGTTGVATLRLHLERYDFAARRCGAGRVLDLACGVGYGTRLLADRNAAITHVQGVDLSESAVDFAQSRYSSDRVQFRCADATRFTDGAPYDAVVSLETIEHISDPHFFAHLVSLVRPGGRLIGSVPSTPSVDGNPHHVRDFTENSFRKLGRDCGLREIDAFQQVQPFSAVAITSGREKRLARSRADLLGFYLRRPDKLALRLWATVCYGFENRYITIAWEKPDVRQ